MNLYDKIVELRRKFEYITRDLSMKKERSIIIRDPSLKRVRNEIRAILRLWICDIRRPLNDAYWAEDNSEKSKKIHKQISELDLMEENSIILCPLCGRRDQDMEYVPTIPAPNEWNLPNQYTVYTHEWICMECNAKRVYFDGLKEEVLTEMTLMDIREFLERLSNGVGLSRFGWRCNGYEESKIILDEMGITKEIQGKFLELCGYYGGYCDCEILLNATIHFLK